MFQFYVTFPLLVISSSYESRNTYSGVENLGEEYGLKVDSLKETYDDNIFDPNVTVNDLHLNASMLTSDSNTMNKDGDGDEFEDYVIVQGTEKEDLADGWEEIIVTEEMKSINLTFIDRRTVWQKFANENMRKDMMTFSVASSIRVAEVVVDAIRQTISDSSPLSVQQRAIRILVAYSARNPGFLITQSVSSLLAVVLNQSWVSDQDAFNLLAAMVEYTKFNLSLANSKKLGKFSFYLTRSSLPVPIEMILVEPILCMLSRLGPLAFSTKVLDIVFIRGSLGMLGLYLGMLELTAPAITRVINRAQIPDSGIVDIPTAVQATVVELFKDHHGAFIRNVESFFIDHSTGCFRLCWKIAFLIKAWLAQS